jgi:hypothetical protein
MDRCPPLRLVVMSVMVVGLLPLAGPAQSSPIGGSPQPGATDFNGDGFADLAIGVPYEGLGAIGVAGAVNVIYGSDIGLMEAGDQFWSQGTPDVEDQAEGADSFGSAVAGGDFNGDGFTDLVIGVPSEDIGSVLHAGAVNVIYGSATGLSATKIPDQFWSQDSTDVIDDIELRDQLGDPLATADFNGDGFTDLAIGVHLEDIGSTSDAGGVNVIYGSPTGLSATKIPDQFWSQDSTDVLDDVEERDLFGFTLAEDDFNGDGFADLAVGVPFESLGPLIEAGAVHLLYGSAGGLTAVGNQLWTQDVSGVLDTAEPGDKFGWSLATGDVNGDAFPDLAIGAFNEDIEEQLDPITDAGAVSVLMGGPSGVSSTGNQFFHQNTVGILGEAESSDQFGQELAAGNLNGDAFADMVVGVPFEDLSISNEGVIHVLLGSASGLSDAGDQMVAQDSPGILDRSEGDDSFGAHLGVGRFDGDGFDDLAIGIPNEYFGQPILVNAGMVAVIYGSASGLSQRDQIWAQSSPGIRGDSESGEYFGLAVT